MTFPISLPDWLPWWVPFAVLVPALLYLLVFLLMPFSVFGVKGRLEAIEERLDEIQGEIRTLVLRMPEPRAGASSWTDPPPPIAPVPRFDEDRMVRPPIPPAPVQPARRPAPQSPPFGAEPPDRPAPDPRRPPAASADDALSGKDAGPFAEPESGEEASRRRPVIRPSRPSRNEPRLDWPG
jgi:hypothetical protein